MTEITSFGEWIQQRRNQLRYTRNGLAELVLCSPVTIKKIERDERRPSPQIAKLLAQHLQIPQSEHENFMARARGEFVPSFSSPAELSWKAMQKDNLPEQVTPFVGRKSEFAFLNDMFFVKGNRLVTLVGAGGMGKTRLALAWAEQQVADNHFMDGVYFVSLAPLSAVDHIIPTLAEAINFHGFAMHIVDSCVQ